jgi:hypothetical protein
MKASASAAAMLQMLLGSLGSAELLGIRPRAVPVDTTALSTKDSFSYAAKLLREILIP